MNLDETLDLFALKNICFDLQTIFLIPNMLTVIFIYI